MVDESSSQPEKLETRLHKALDPAKSQIRVLQIHPASDPMSAPRCTIDVVSLDESPLYMALSYEWGDPKGEELRSWEGQTLFVDDEEIQVTKNLYAALLYVRQLLPHAAASNGRKSYLWIDAVCINQSNHEERRQQVELMGKIYSLASTVLLWVGGERGNSHIAIGFIKEEFAERERQNNNVPSEWLVHKLTDLSYKTRWFALVQLSQRSFWRRSWIIQEIVLARKPILVCGADTLALPMLFTFLGDLRHIMESKIYANPPKLLAKILTSLFHIYTIKGCKENYEEKIDSKRGLLNLLENLRQTLASDRRDKVYSLLGMARQYGDVRLSIDYEISPTQVFKNTAAYIILGTENLDILTVAISDNNDLPTWVPDWLDHDWTDPFVSGKNRVRGQSVNPSGVLSSGGPTFPSVTFVDNNTVLTIQAIPVSRIDQITVAKTHPGPGPNANDSMSFEQVIEELKDLVLFLTSDYDQAFQRKLRPGASESLEEAKPELSTQAILVILQAVLSLLYRNLFRGLSFFSKILSAWPPDEFVRFCMRCLHGPVTPSDYNEDQMTILWSGLSHAGVVRKFFKCKLPETFGWAPMVQALFTSEDLESVRVDLERVFSQAPALQVSGKVRGQIEAGDSIMVIPGCKSPLILRRISQGDCAGYYRIVGEAYCEPLMHWSSLPDMPSMTISII